jgi:CheY-like chemotaxis protein
MEHVSTILIVDDEPGGRKTLEALLIAQGYQLAFASSGAEALEKAAGLGPDLILLDVMMPGMDGFEVCQRLRADPLLAEVPIIMVTALDDRDSRLRGIEAGADDFVSKPFDRAELRARVRTVTRLNRYRRLLLERAKFEWVVEQADDGYLIVGHNDGVLYANPQARLYLDFPVDIGELIPGTFLESAQKWYRCEPQEAWAAWPAQPPISPPSARYLVRPESDAATAVWLQVDVLDMPAGPDAGRLVRLRNISAQKDLQRSAWTLQIVIPHKLRTPLTNMVGSLEVMARHSSQLSSEEITDFAEMALRNVKRLHSQVEDILQYLSIPDLARSGTGFNLSQLQPMVAEIRTHLGLETVTVSGQETLGDAHVPLSPQAFELILWEILENAKKFHPSKSPVVEMVLSRKSDSEYTRPEVSIQIRDDGLTLSPVQLAQVWTPYYQVEKQFTGEVTGMGLGLPMVALLVWSVGGTCRIHNREQGPGVVVELVLPLSQ